MLNEFSLSKYLWAEIVNTVYYIINRVGLRTILKRNSVQAMDES
jgi:hypothetical protein